MKKSTTQPKHDHHTKSIVLLYVLFVILAATLVLVTCILKATRDEARVQSDNTLIRMLRSASDNLFRETIIEPKEGKQYMYDMGLRFPISNEDDRILASWALDDNGQKSTVVTSKYLQATAGSILGYPGELDSDEFMKSVSMFQKCNRPFVLQYSVNGVSMYPGEFEQVDSKSLANGKTLYLFRSTACHSKYHDGDKYTNAELDRLQAQLMKAESY